MRKASPPGPTWASAGRVLGIALIAFTLLVGAAIPAAAAELMRVTFVRHAQSAGNASGNIDTSTPGPSITALGQEQAKAVIGKLGANNYDAIYASTMVRTQQTAAPMSEHLRLPIQVLPGLQEIEAGIFEGTPESQAQNGYGRFPLAWALADQRDTRIPGSINGHEFDARVDGALQTIYGNGDRNAVVYSHGGAIMFWTMMNATNLTTAQKLNLLQTAALKNTDYVVIEGNPEDGWRVVNWNGQEFGAQPTLESEVQLQLRTFQRQVSAQVQKMVAAFSTLDPAKVLAAVAQGAAEITYSVTKFAGAVQNQLAKEIAKLTPPTETVQTVAARTSAPAAVAKSVAVTDAPTAATQVKVAAASNTEATGAATGDAPKTKPETTPSEVSKGAAVEKTEPIAKTEPATTTNGATDLKDGNKAVPGTTNSDQSTSAGDKVAVAVSADARSDVDGTDATGSTDAGDAGDAGSDGTGGESE